MLFLVIFVGATYLVMCNVRYGMNLRYANMWDMPLRYLAGVCLASFTDPIARYRRILWPILIALLSLYDLRQYHILFVTHPLYELVTGGLLHALQILK